MSLRSFPDPLNPVYAFQNFNQISIEDSQPPLLRENITILPNDTQVIWFFGDLNFRMRGSKQDWAALGSNKKEPQGLSTSKEIIKMIQSNRINDLVEKDELTYLRNQKRGVLAQFSEAPITFLPSYKLEIPKSLGKLKQKVQDKVDADLNVLDRSNPSIAREYSKKRLPAYCDRILYFSDPRHTVTSLHYTRITNYTFSDHDPVVGMYHLEQVQDATEKKLVHRDGWDLLFQRIYRFWICSYRWIIPLLLLYLIF